MPNIKYGPGPGDINSALEEVYRRANDPFRKSENETVTIRLDRYEEMLRCMVVHVKHDDKDKHLSAQVQDQSKKISDLESEIKTYQRFLGALVADSGGSELFNSMCAVAREMGLYANSIHDGVSLSEEDIYDAVARKRDETQTDDLPY
jgi:hypothetical protein